MSTVVSAPVRVLADEVQSAPGGIGGQVAVFADGALVECASVGTSAPDQPMAAETLHNVWCGTKPIFHTAALHGLWRAGRGDTALSELLPPKVRPQISEAVGQISPRDLVSHRVGICDPHVMEAMHTPIAERTDLVLRRLNQAEIGAPAGTYAPSKLLELALEETLGVDAADYVEKWCQERLDFADEIRFNIPPTELSSVAPRIGPYALTHYHQTSYSYHDRVPSVACEDRVAVGGFVTMRALAEFYSVLTSASSLDTDFRTWLLDATPVQVYDDSIGRPTHYLSGFQTEVAGRTPDVAFLGLPGLTGASFGFAFPDHRVSGAFMVNQFFQSPDDIDFFRARMVRAIEAEHIQ
ncbi:MAG: beta-lactamase family protein [Salinibacterium sp.]|nr:beta-lactamase family protein [Salinibacterium sp.]